MLLLYLTAYMNITVRAPADKSQEEILLVHFTFGLITPIGQLLRATLVGLNLFSTLCSGSPPVKATNGSGIVLFGGPILYLIGQSLFLFGILIWSDHGFGFPSLRKSGPSVDSEGITTKEPEVLEEINRITASDDGLRVLHASKTYKKYGNASYSKAKVVDDLTFGVKKGEVFALLGPNGGMSKMFKSAYSLLTII